MSSAPDGSTGSFTQGPITPALIKFALPILFVSVLSALNVSINSIWVGRYLGEAALAATSNANTVMLLLAGATTGIGLAAGIMIGQCIGANDVRRAKSVVGTGATFFCITSVGIGIAGLIFSEPLLTAMKTPASALPLASEYTRIIFLALPGLYLYAFVVSVLRASGDSKTPFYFLLLSVALDIALNPLFIFGIGPVPRLGIAGSALATVVGQTGSLIALVIYLYRDGHVLCLRRGELSMLRLDWAITGVLIRKGSPISGQILLLSLSSLLMIMLVNRFGVDTAAAYGASLQVWTYVSMIASAIAATTSTITAQNVGARLWDRVKSTAQIGVIYGVLGTLVIVAAMEIFDTYIFKLFLPTGSGSVQIASHINRIATWSWVFSAVSAVLFAVTRAVGSVVAPLAIATFSLLVVRYPLADALIERWHEDAIWWSFPISAALDAVLATLYFKYGSWRTMQFMTPVSAIVE